MKAFVSKYILQSTVDIRFKNGWFKNKFRFKNTFINVATDYSNKCILISVIKNSVLCMNTFWFRFDTPFSLKKLAKCITNHDNSSTFHKKWHNFSVCVGQMNEKLKQAKIWSTHTEKFSGNWRQNRTLIIKIFFVDQVKPNI